VSAAGKASEELAKGAARRLGPYLPPYVIAAAAYPLADILHAEFGSTPWTSVGVTLVGTCLTGVAWNAGSSRSKGTRLHATVSTGIGMAWLTAASITGLAAPTDKAGALAGGGLALSWTIKRMLRNSGTEHGGDGERSNNSLWELLKLPGIKVRRTEVKPNKLIAELQLPGGKVLPDELAAAAPRIAGALGVASTGVRVQADPNRADRATLTVVPEDVLRDSPTWPGPSHFGGTMADPLRFGVYEDGADAVFYAAASQDGDRQLTHILIQGLSRTGKGVGARNLLTEIVTRRESTLWMVDTAKAHQNLGAAEEMIDWFATTPAQAKAMFKALPAIINARSEFLGKRGYDNWMPGCGVNHLIVWIEEASGPLRDFEAMVDTVGAAASVGILFVVSTQRASHDNIPTSIRANLGASLVFGTRDLIDTQMALPDSVIEAGAHPEEWGTKKPGYCYLWAPGVDPERYPTPIRTYGHPFGIPANRAAESLRTWIARCAPYRDALDQLTVDAAGQAYRERTRLDGSRPGEDEPNDAIPMPAGPAASRAALPGDPTTQDQDEQMDANEEQEMPEQVRDFIAGAMTDLDEPEPVVDGVPPLDPDLIAQAAERLAALAPDPEDDAEQDPEDESGPVDPLAALSGVQERMTPRQGRDHVLRHILALNAEQPGRAIDFELIAPAVAETGYGASWGRKRLREFMDEGLLDNPEFGVYRVLRQPAGV
jgi:hypothetical protein